MEKRYIQTLHVEDDRIQQLLVARLLKQLIPNHEFIIENAVDENTAVDLFKQKPRQLVLIDYELSEGNGLECLRRIRKIDRVVPVIALSGKASREIAGQLVTAGADDFLRKEGLSAQSLRDAVVPALTRTELLQRRTSDPIVNAESEARLQSILTQFLNNLGPDWFTKLESFSTELKTSQATKVQIETLLAKSLAGLAKTRQIPENRLRSTMQTIFVQLLSDAGA